MALSFYQVAKDQLAPPKTKIELPIKRKLRNNYCNERFGKLVAIKIAIYSHPIHYTFICDCGKIEDKYIWLVRKAGDKAACSRCLKDLTLKMRNKK